MSVVVAQPGETIFVVEYRKHIQSSWTATGLSGTDKMALRRQGSKEKIRNCWLEFRVVPDKG